MVTHFITFTVDLQPVAELHRSIAVELQKQGDSLRWAIVAVDTDRQQAIVEAVITTPTELLLSNVLIRTI